MQLILEFSPRRRCRRETQADRVLKMLLDAHYRGEWVTNVDFLNAVPRLPNFRSRFEDVEAALKRMGLNLKVSDAVYVQPGCWKYRLEENKE